MTATQERLNLDQLQVRAAVVDDVDEDDGLVEVRIMPYEHEIELDLGYTEIFTRGAFSGAVTNPSRVKVTDQQHNRKVVIGMATKLRDEPDAIYGTLKIADTAAGRDVLTLLRAKMLTEMSAEFMPQRKYREVTQRNGGLHVRHHKATLVGVSPVSQGAAGQEARVISVRAAEANRVREQELAYLASLTAGRAKG